MYAVVDGQPQGYRVLTALGIVKDVIHVLGGGIGLTRTVADKLFTGRYHRMGMYVAVDGQPQGYRVLTALGIVKDVIHVLGGGIGLTRTVPDKLFTGRYHRIGMYAGVEDQRVGYRVLTALGIVKDVIHVLGGGIGLTRTVPDKLFTCRYPRIRMYAVVDGQPQGYRVLTALGIVKDVIHVLGGGIGLTRTVPDKLFTGRYHRIGMYA